MGLGVFCTKSIIIKRSPKNSIGNCLGPYSNLILEMPACTDLLCPTTTPSGLAVGRSPPKSLQCNESKPSPEP